MAPEEADIPHTRGNAIGSGGRRAMTREDLYVLVWQTPMTRLAKAFGLSDVGLRKICIKHDIPTPPVGYWAKLAHGKRVHQPLLPVSDGPSIVHLVAQTGPAVSPEVAVAQDEILARETQHPPIMVPDERPARFHPVAAATAKTLRSAKADTDGFKHGLAPGGVEVTIGRQSVDRALRIIDAFARAAKERGYVFAEDPAGVRIVVDDIPLSWRLYEIKDRVPHTPTREELQAQARHDESRARWPSLYSSRKDAKVYRTWDHLPSGRLAMTLTDATRSCWGQEGRIGHWCDRKSKGLEDYLDDAMAALATGMVSIKHRLAEEAERERRRAEALEKQRREQAKRERATKRHEYLLRKADDYARYEKLAALAEFMQRRVYRYSEDEPVDRLFAELKALLALMEQGFKRDALQDEIVRLELYTEDDIVSDPDTTGA